MFKRVFCILVCLVVGGIFSSLAAEEADYIERIQILEEDVNRAIDGMVIELNNIGTQTDNNSNMAGATNTGGCVEVDIELPDTVYWENPIGLGIAEGYFELTNCGDEAAEIWLEFSITINISYLIDTTIVLPPFPVHIGAGETVVHECHFPVPPIEGNVTVCAAATSGDATDSDCASMAIVGLGTGGIPFEANGVLLQGTGCIVFAPAADWEHAFVLENYGEFGVGDTVHVVGHLFWGCDVECPEAVGCINDNSIEAAGNPGLPFESCGYLVESQGCLLFIPRLGNDGPYNPADTSWQMVLTLENYGEFQSGDSVFVTGTLFMEYDPDCPHAIGKILENIIEPCDDWPPTPFEGCGVLVEGVECILFSPINHYNVHFVLDNYGSFTPGDTVYVHGFLIPDCESVCMQGNGCIVDNTIEACNDMPNTYIESCGILYQTQNCMLFAPFNFTPDNQTVLFNIHNYIGFGHGDTVFVTGLAVFGCEIYCDMPIIGCIVENTIDACTGHTPPINYEGCGIIIAGIECTLFAPLNTGDSLVYMLDDYHGYMPDDTVFVSGWLTGDCDYYCAASSGCIHVDYINYCNGDPTFPYEACGVLTGYPDCVLFTPLGDYYTRILLDNYGEYGHGDTVYVSGLLSPGCEIMCDDTAISCLNDNSIGPCDNLPPDTLWYEGCGLLMEQAGCLLFFTFEDYLPPLLLSNYGDFTAFDTVFVAGMVNLFCEPACGNSNIGCMNNEVIEDCGGDPGIPYEGCGLLVQFDNCIAFMPMDTAFTHYILENYGSFGIGDTVYVAGLLDGYTDACSLQTMPFIANHAIEYCDGGDPGIPFEGCGVLEHLNWCLLFRPFDVPDSVGLFMTLDNYGDFSLGDTVFVAGLITANCDSSCMEASACIPNNFIGHCDSLPPDTLFYSGCGILMDDTGCVRFHPLAGNMPPATLDNYGDFHEGDTVYVEGFVDADCALDCAYGFYICLHNDFIGHCNGQTQDSIYFTGCGTLADENGCLIFNTPLDNIPPVLLTDYGGFTVGDSIFVEGWVDLLNGCECHGTMYACMHNIVIEFCDTPPDSFYFEGCGMLVDDTGCVFFYPGDNSFHKVLLSDYGEYSIGDSVYVEGLVMLNLPDGCECYNLPFSCMHNSLITVCGGPVKDSDDIKEFDVHNFPNPFNPKTTISIYLPQPVTVTLKVYNILGREVETLIDNKRLQGQQNIEWNGGKHASGVYFYRLDMGDESVTRKMMLTK